jgi:mono/diheme cytochrome c family protein
MARRIAVLLFATSLAGLAGGLARHVRSAAQAPAAEQRLSGGERARLLAKGKELFVAWCAKCHDECGDKPLSTGLPLSERGLANDQIAQAVKGRLRDRTEEERRAVTLYISTLMTTKDSEVKPAPKP